MNEPRHVRVDAVVIGGGVAALWTANRLKGAGHSVCVLTNGPLGEGQSLAAQGVIHGGLKYALGGALTDSSEALADMPARWLAALAGEGPVDLGGAELLSDHQVLWSLPGAVSRVAGFFGSRAVRGRAGRIARHDYPAVFDTPAYRGRLFRIEEPVVDPVSVIRELARGMADETHLVDWRSNAELLADRGRVDGIRLTEPDGTAAVLTADEYVFAAGAGNAGLLERAGIHSPAMQRRPLHQLVIRAPDLPDFYSVCVGRGPKPPLVSTTHVDSRGRRLWYIGGEIAESEGVARDAPEQIEAGEALFARLMPWIDLAGAEWFTWRGDRAEPATESGARPSGAFCRRVENVLVAWPTKFALAPDLADQVLAETGDPGGHEPTRFHLPRPAVGTPPWDRA